MKNPKFWLFSDDVRWGGHRVLAEMYPRGMIQLPLHNETLFESFHRMVMADGLVLSESSLSTAAALISNCSKIVTYDHSIKYNYVRSEW
jgi:hypothetical protein